MKLQEESRLKELERLSRIDSLEKEKQNLVL
jgi:hypothetical protein